MCDCYVLSGRGLCDSPITHPEESYRLCVCLSVIVKHYEVEALAREGLLRHGKEGIVKVSATELAQFPVHTV